MGLNVRKLIKRLPGKNTKQTLLGLGPLNLATGGILAAQMGGVVGNTKEGRKMMIEDKEAGKYIAPLVGMSAGGTKIQHEMRLARSDMDEQRRQSDLGTESDMASAQALQEQQEEFLKKRRRSGYSSTILSGMDKGSAPIYRKTLLGG